VPRFDLGHGRPPFQANLGISGNGSIQLVGFDQLIQPDLIERSAHFQPPIRRGPGHGDPVACVDHSTGIAARVFRRA
jgi:hypothetical protein